MHYVITGGAGFIGSHIVERLIKNKKNRITVVDNFSTGNKDNIKNFKNNIKLVRADISKKGKWMSHLHNAHFIFHFAALADIVPSIEKPDKYYDANVTGTFNVIQSCLNNKKLKKLIYAASSSCYGIPKKFPTPENSEINNQYPYALTKYLGEQLIQNLCRTYNIPYISLRFFNVYGTRSRTSGTYGAVFGVFLAQKIAGKPFTVVGDGEQTRDFTYVSDVVEAVILAAKTKHTNLILNIGSGKTISINHLIKLIKGDVVHIPKRPAEPQTTWGDISKAKKILKWKPKITIEVGIKNLIKNIDYWKKAPVWNPKSISKATKLWFKYL
ncbi:GDP-mannose 4,6-dehydratase [bacterium]|nr:GDP-mannose 4,6-dehydratase [bacterium]